MNMTTFTTYREPQIERFPRLSGFSVEVSVTPGNTWCQTPGTIHRPSYETGSDLNVVNLSPEC